MRAVIVFSIEIETNTDRMQDVIATVEPAISTALLTTPCVTAIIDLPAGAAIVEHLVERQQQVLTAALQKSVVAFKPGKRK